jgi:hypothetical protein
MLIRSAHSPYEDRAALRSPPPWGAAPRVGRRLLNFEDATFTRASEASALISDARLRWFGSNVLRPTFRGGVGHYLIENTTQNVVPYSEDLSEWTPNDASGSLALDAGGNAAPDGESDAYQITFGTHSNDHYRIDLVLGDDSNYVYTAWVRTASGTKDFRLIARNNAGTLLSSADFTATTTWQQFEHQFDSASGATAPQVRINNDVAVGAAGTIQFWGAQCERDVAPSAYVRTAGAAAARPDDIPGFSEAPAAMESGRWRILVRPQWSSVETNGVANPKYLFQFTNGADDVIRITNSEELNVRQGSANKVTTSALTWARNALLDIVFDPVAGTLTLAGFASGNGVHSGTSWSWTSDRLYVGTLGSGSGPFPGGYSEPVRA